jgi:prepilin-type N-terminal cleavage/methylation domain-containing protein
MKKLRRGLGYTLLEMVMVLVILAILVFSVYSALRAGQAGATTSTEHLTAMQSALILMESVAEDCRQICILNEFGMPLMPYSLAFSTNGKSFMMRKSSRNAEEKDNLGSAFTVVVYQLVRNRKYDGVFTIRRLERTTDGRPLPGIGREEDEKAFDSLLLKDIRFDFVVKLENMSSRTYVRVSLTAVNTGVVNGRDPKLYFVSNLFEIASPEFIHSRPGQVGFAQRFIISNKWVLGSPFVKAGDGFYEPLPPTGWPDSQQFDPFNDYLDVDGTTKNFPVPQMRDVVRPFDTKSVKLPGLRDEFCTNAVRYLQEVLSKDFRGKIMGQVLGPGPAGVPPPWAEAFSFDASATVTQTLKVQVNNLLVRVMKHGAEGVEEMGHTILTQIKRPTECDAVEAPPSMISTCQAQAIINAQ